MHEQDLHRVDMRLGWRKRITSSRACCVAGGFLLATFIGGPAMAATFVVDTTSDVSLSACTVAAGDCSLRGAIAAANVAADLDLIEFDIPTNDPGCDADGICRIAVGSSLSISRGLTIDGYTQPGSQPNTIPAPGANNAQLGSKSPAPISSISGWRCSRCPTGTPVPSVCVAWRCSCPRAPSSRADCATIIAATGFASMRVARRPRSTCPVVPWV